MVKISTYIPTYNALFFQSTLEETIRQALLFSDEIVVVNSEHSTDGTQFLLEDLKAEYPNIIKLYMFKEDPSATWETVADKKTFAMRKCTGDYCILQDDDEMIHEKYTDFIREIINLCPDTIAFRFNTIHFYRSYNHYQSDESRWYQRKIYMVKNIPEIKHGKVNDDYDNHIILDKKAGEPKHSLLPDRYVPLDSLKSPYVINTPITSYHYGWTRNDATLLIKKWFQEMRWHGKNYWNDKEFPFKFDDPDKLKKFEGSHPEHIKYRVKAEKYKSLNIKDFSL